MSEASVKLLSRGVETLTDQELLELLLDDGDSERLAGALLSSFEGRLAALGYADIARLRMAAGIGLKRAARIQAAVELGRRVLAARELGPDPIGSSNDVVRIFRPLLTEMKHEECWCLYLNGQPDRRAAAGKPGRGAGDGGGSPVGHQTGPRTAGHADYPGSQPSFRCCLAQRAG